jgi:hypothetical protein
VHLGNCIAQCHPKLDRDDYATPVVRMAGVGMKPDHSLLTMWRSLYHHGGT